MNNDPKIPFSNVDASVRSFTGQARELSISYEEDRVMHMLGALEPQGNESAFEKVSRQYGFHQTIEISTLPIGFDTPAPRAKSVTEQLEAMRNSKEAQRPSFSQTLSKLVGRKRQFDTGLEP